METQQQINIQKEQNEQLEKIKTLYELEENKQKTPLQIMEIFMNSFKTRQKEKQKNSEVFTPFWFIEQMFADLEKYYFKQYGKNIYQQKDLTWMDPCAGFGNFFLVLFPKLYENLKEQIPDNQERKLHILNNMLYFAEINSESVEIIEYLFQKW